MKPNIRIATQDDTEKLITLRFDYFKAEKWEMTPEQHSTIEANLLRYFSNHIGRDFFAGMVELDNKVASTAFLVISEKPANVLSFPTGKTGTILNVLTYPGHRRKGYATQAIRALIEIAKQQNLSYIELSASESGKPLYRDLGFQERDFSQSRFTEMKLSLL